MYYFLKVDFDALESSITTLRDRIRGIGQEMGDSCREGAETFHDNFTHEEGSRQLQMWSKRYSELMAIKGNATIVIPQESNERVAIGKKVRMRNTFNNDVTNLEVGSYMVLSENGSFSYGSPLIKMILGAKKGELRAGTIGELRVSFIIEEIS